ncbi:MAG: A/G-specific adenine glycosylase [Deltaproteobacteria bacterium]|nr:A/G-specific adenine glycosylase [Deltaproteobacteria bacterium]
MTTNTTVCTEALYRWYRAHARELPWRNTDDPYAIWISEVMLQQTQVSTVIPYFERWIARFPAVKALAAADQHEVLRLWEGLGYYSRARNLHRAAQQLVERGTGFPSEPAAFSRLSGVGPYTTAAVMSIAFGHRLAAVDGNVKRVISRLYALDLDITSSAGLKRIAELAEQLLSDADPALHNQSMMELGALICRPKDPQCETCPLREPCQARLLGTPTAYPLRAPKAPTPHHHDAVALIYRQTELLIAQRPQSGLLAGLWHFPRIRGKTRAPTIATISNQLAQNYGLRVAPLANTPPCPKVDHAYTHFRVSLYPRLLALVGAPTTCLREDTEVTRWVAADQLADYPMSVADRKVAQAAGLGDARRA